jgi:bifunctional DNase/RNase
MEADAGDAVALALRAEAPIYATEEVLSGAGYRGGEPPD